MTQSRKIVINRCYGGFGLSQEARALYLAKTGQTDVSDLDFVNLDIARDDPVLVEIVETLGAAANTRFSKLAVISVPHDVDWQIEEYDGVEWVAEKHRTWPCHH